MIDKLFKVTSENYEAIEKARKNIKLLTTDNPQQKEYTFLDKYHIHVGNDITKDGVVIPRKALGNKLVIIPLDEIKLIEDITGTVFVRADDKNYYFCWKFKIEDNFIYREEPKKTE